MKSLLAIVRKEEPKSESFNPFPYHYKKYGFWTVTRNLET